MNPNTFHIPAEITPTLDEGILEDEYLEAGLNYLRSINASIKYGDMVIFDKIAGYRNDGVAIYDGTKIVDLASEPDDYGNLPQQFKVLEAPHYFPIDYWKDSIAHNSIVWFDHRPYKGELLSSFKWHPQDKSALVASFTGPDNQTYQIVFGFDLYFADKLYKERRENKLPQRLLNVSAINNDFIRPSNSLTQEWLNLMLVNFINLIQRDELFPFYLEADDLTEGPTELNTLYVDPSILL